MVLDVEIAVNNFLDGFLEWNRRQIKNKDDIYLILDAEWSHSGWWTKECTIIAVDGNTGLSVYIQHAIRGTNYTESSRGSKLFYFKFHRNGRLESTSNNARNIKIRIYVRNFEKVPNVI